MIDAQLLAIDFHRVKSFSKEGGNLVENPALHTDKLVFGALTKFCQIQFFFKTEFAQFPFRISLGRDGRAGFRHGEWIKLAHGQRRGYFERRGTAHARADRERAVNGRVESAEVNAMFSELLQNSFDIIHPRSGGIFF